MEQIMESLTKIVIGGIVAAAMVAIAVQIL